MFNKKNQKSKPTPLTLVLKYDSNISNHSIFIKYNENQYKYLVYKESFRSGNKLHFHFKEQYPKIKNILSSNSIQIKPLLSITVSKTILVTDKPNKSVLKLANKHPQIIKSITKTISATPSYIFKKRKYTQIKIALNNP